MSSHRTIRKLQKQIQEIRKSHKHKIDKKLTHYTTGTYDGDGPTYYCSCGIMLYENNIPAKEEYR